MLQLASVLIPCCLYTLTMTCLVAEQTQSLIQMCALCQERGAEGEAEGEAGAGEEGSEGGAAPPGRQSG